MATDRNAATASLRQIGTLFEAGAIGQLSDRQLLERFLAGRGETEAEAAFELLVRRHGPMVQGVCRAMLHDHNDVDDAFQASFLVLARRAGAIRERDAVASWLYGVACRVAARARADASRRRSLERHAALKRHESTPAQTELIVATPELFEEVQRLPERYRAPIVLCYLEGQTHEQASGTLCCPVRTLQTRLLRAKARLRSRLIRRGLAPSAGLIAAERLATDADASLPPAVVESTTRAASEFAASRGTGALAASEAAKKLALGVSQLMVRRHLPRTFGLAAGLLAGAALVVFGMAAAEKQTAETVKSITGRVSDAAGRPIPSAEVWLPVTFSSNDVDTSHALTDAQGRYTLKVPDAWESTPQHQREWIVWAFAPGHQIATASAHEALTGKPQSVDMTLGPATDTSFRVLGPDGRPVAGAVIEPFHFKTPMAYNFPPRAMLPLVRAVTDAAGRASLPALPREGFMTVQVSTKALGIQRLRLKDKASEPADRVLRLRPAARLEGRILAPEPEQARGLRIFVETRDPAGTGVEQSTGGAEVVTAEDGTFTVPAIATGTLEVGVQSRESLPIRPKLPETMVVRRGEVNRLEIPLVAAVKARGKIQVKGVGKPVPGASVHVSYGSGRARVHGRFRQGGTVRDLRPARRREATGDRHARGLRPAWRALERAFQGPDRRCDVRLALDRRRSRPDHQGAAGPGQRSARGGCPHRRTGGREAVRIRTDQGQRGVHPDRRPPG